MQKQVFLSPLINYFNSTHLSLSILWKLSIPFCSTFFWNTSSLNLITQGKNRKITFETLALELDHCPVHLGPMMMMMMKNYLTLTNFIHKLTIKKSRFEKNLKRERKINKQSYILNWKLKVLFLKTQIFLNFLMFSLVTFHWKSQLLNLHQLNILCFCTTILTELQSLPNFLSKNFVLSSQLHHERKKGNEDES